MQAFKFAARVAREHKRKAPAPKRTRMTTEDDSAAAEEAGDEEDSETSEEHEDTNSAADDDDDADDGTNDGDNDDEEGGVEGGDEDDEGGYEDNDEGGYEDDEDDGFATVLFKKGALRNKEGKLTPMGALMNRNVKVHLKALNFFRKKGKTYRDQPPLPAVLADVNVALQHAPSPSVTLRAADQRRLRRYMEMADEMARIAARSEGSLLALCGALAKVDNGVDVSEELRELVQDPGAAATPPAAAPVADATAATGTPARTPRQQAAARAGVTRFRLDHLRLDAAREVDVAQLGELWMADLPQALASSMPKFAARVNQTADAAAMLKVVLKKLSFKRTSPLYVENRRRAVGRFDVRDKDGDTIDAYSMPKEWVVALKNLVMARTTNPLWELTTDEVEKYIVSFRNGDESE